MGSVSEAAFRGCVQSGARLGVSGQPVRQGLALFVLERDDEGALIKVLVRQFVCLNSEKYQPRLTLHRYGLTRAQYLYNMRTAAEAGQFQGTAYRLQTGNNGWRAL